MPRLETKRVSTRPIRELAARRLSPGTTRELLLRLPDAVTADYLVVRLAGILEAAEIESEQERAGPRVERPAANREAVSEREPRTA